MGKGNKILIASENAMKKLKEHYINIGVDKEYIDDVIFVKDKDCEYFTGEAQDLFNKFYDEELNKIE
jgi:hypothetical protein